MLNVEEIMTDNPISVETTTSVRKALSTLLNADIRHLPVVDQGELAGMLSDRDFREFSFDPFHDDPSSIEDRMERPVSEHMSGDVLFVEKGTDVTIVVDMMVEHKIGAVPVVDNTKSLVGIVSYIDVLAALREQL